MIRNLWAGLKVAFFLKCDARDFRVSHAALWFIVLLYCLFHCGIDYYGTEKPPTFSAYGLASEAVTFSAILLAGFLASLLFRDASLALALPVVAFNARLVPTLLSRFLIWGLHPAWTSNSKDMGLFATLLSTWYFLIFFRSLLLFTGTKARRQLIGAMLLMAAIYGPFRYIAVEAYWYKETGQSDDSQEPEGFNLPFPWGRNLWAEDIIPLQQSLLQQQFDAVKGRTKGRNIYMALFGGYGGQNVFMKEVFFARTVLENKLRTKNHSVILINNPTTVTTYPLATVANLRQALLFFSHKADVKHDLLLLYFTSHGSPFTGLSVELSDIGLKQLDGAALKKLLKESGFKWKVVIVASCYSGTFIDALKDDDTVIMTASRRDRTSFGCSDEADLTYFGDAYFKQALPRADGLIAAFDSARKIIAKMEDDTHVTPHSEPQIYVGSAIKSYLNAK